MFRDFWFCSSVVSVISVRSYSVCQCKWFLFSSSLTAFCVLQGSVCSPILFIMYNSPLHDIVAFHGIPDHGYADFEQLYISFHSGFSSMSSLALPNPSCGLQRINSSSTTARQICSSDLIKLLKKRSSLSLLSFMAIISSINLTRFAISDLSLTVTS
jgi:hypothetical protein